MNTRVEHVGFGDEKTIVCEKNLRKFEEHDKRGHVDGGGDVFLLWVLANKRQRRAPNSGSRIPRERFASEFGCSLTGQNFSNRPEAVHVQGRYELNCQ